MLKTITVEKIKTYILCEITLKKKRSPDQTTLEGSSGTSIMTYTGGCGYIF